MEEKGFIITVTGPSQSGKSLILEKIQQLGKKMRKEGIPFFPQKMVKYTTRHLRLEEMKLQNQGKDGAVKSVKEIPGNCDVVYQTYGVRYGLDTKDLERELEKGCSPVVVLNDIRAVEEIRRCFLGRVLSLFMFRKIPELEDFKREAQDRGNVSEQEVVARYEKAVAIYRIYIENIVLFDHVILNSVEYVGGQEKSNDTILDMQIKNVLLPIIQGTRMLRSRDEYPKSPRIFVIAGNAASGKDELIRALLSMGKLQARVLPKYTMRPQEREDGTEMICRYIPNGIYIKKMEEEYECDKKSILENLNCISDAFKKRYMKEFTEFQQQLEESNQSAYSRFWEMIAKKVAEQNGLKNDILEEYFEENEKYKDLQNIKNSFHKVIGEGDVGVYEQNGMRYLIYGKDEKLYGCDITGVHEELEKKNHHQIIVASQMGVVNVLKELYGKQNVKLIYAHSDISVGEFEANSSDITKDDKKKEFKRILESYTREISNYDHVTIYAKSQLTYEQTSKEEELVDQMFRLLRAYL